MGCLTSKHGPVDGRDGSSVGRDKRFSNNLACCFYPHRNSDSERDGDERSSVWYYENFVSPCSSDIDDEPTENPTKTTVFPGSTEECLAAGWPSWLVTAAGEGLYGMKPRNNNSYRRLCQIGEGTYGSVFKCKDYETSRMVALKQVRIQYTHPEDLKFLAREIRILRKIDHPNVVKLEGIVASPTPTDLLLALEYIPDEFAFLIGSEMFPESQVRCYMRQLLSGLDHCHSNGILHRDIKGSNVLINKEGVLKIIDFGLSQFFDPSKREKLTNTVVTLWYRPPELLLGATEYGPAVDLWSVGCLFGEMLTGEPVFSGKTEIEQLDMIFDVCGAPPDDYWTSLNLSRPANWKSGRSRKNRIPKIFKKSSPSAVALLQVLLSLDPKLRGTAASALRSDFFQ